VGVAATLIGTHDTKRGRDTLFEADGASGVKGPWGPRNWMARTKFLSYA